MSAAPLDLRTPQMECPTCHAVVRITAKGTIAQHTRGVAKTAFSRGRRGGWHHSTVDKRCPSSFTAAPEGAYAAWLRDRYTASAKRAEECGATAHGLRVTADAHDAEALVHANRAAEVSAALAAIGATP
mgnify:FL=1